MSKSWMIDRDDPAREIIVQLASRLGIGDYPEKASYILGKVTLKDGTTVRAHVIHAVDSIITDGNELVMINRLKEPKQGLPALPGGFIDPLDGDKVESPFEAAAREAKEEAFEGIEISFENGALIGTRNMYRPNDIRIARGNGLEEKYGIVDGEVFMVSTQAVRFNFPDLKNTPLAAGDDAVLGSARRVKIDSLTRDNIGIEDHYDMIVEAFPEKFKGRSDGQQWKDSLGNRGGRKRG
jgi:hypothetical protein